MKMFRSFGISLFFVLSMTIWENKEVKCQAGKHAGEEFDVGGVSHSLERYERSAPDCSQPDGTGELITTITRANEVLCNLSVKRTLCNNYCDEEMAPSTTAGLRINHTAVEKTLRVYSVVGSQKFIACDIKLKVKAYPQLSSMTIACQDFRQNPCIEGNSTVDNPSCYLCYSDGLPPLCGDKDKKHGSLEEIAGNDKGPLIGGVIGGGVGVVLIVIVVVVCVRSKRRSFRPKDLKHEENKMEVPEKEDISDDESLPDPPQDAHQRQSVNQYESVTELGTPQFHKINKKPTNDDYIYIHDRDLEWKCKIRKGQPACPLPVNQITKSISLEDNENDGYNRLCDSIPQSTATTKSYSARKRDNQIGNTNDAYNHAGDSTDSVARDIYHRLDNANEDEDTYNHAGDSVHDPEVIDTYNHIKKESDTHNRGGDVNYLSKATDDYHRLGGVAQVEKTSACYIDRDDCQNDTDAYNRLGDINEESQRIGHLQSL